MSDQTKACNLTKHEIVELLRYHGMKLHQPNDEAVERIKYLNKRLNEFSQGDTKSEPNAAGWSSNNG